GRYPWGSGTNAHQRHKSFLDHVDELKKKGLSEAEIAKGLGLESTTQLRALRSHARREVRKSEMLQAVRLKDKGMSNAAIAERMGLSGESQVRALLNPEMKERNDRLAATADMLRQQVADKTYLDIGVGTEHYLGVSNQRMKTAIAVLEEEGYKEFYVPVKQLGTGKITNTKVLAPPGTTFPDVMANQDKIRGINAWSDDSGKSWTTTMPPLQVNPKRIAVRYGDEGGAEADGVIEIRRGVEDLSMGGARYAQVR